uniref:Disease resistance RPP13-like protein 4 n=1 Tax=Anthurium amnicola TaxID=1678845 RepID=A0A1D1ZAW2_9ARAE
MADEVVKLIDKFNNLLQEEKGKFPCRGKLKKIGEDLDPLKSAVTGDLSEGIIKEAKELLDELHGILKECLEHKNDTCAGNFKAVSAWPRLRGLTKRLEKIRGGTAQGSAGEGKPEESSKEARPYQWTSSYIELEKIYGMDQQAKDVVDHLEKTTSFSAVGIVGLLGSGKTALAQKVFMDERVMDKFALRLWVCISPDHCQPEEVVKRMLDNLGVGLDEVEGVLTEHCGPGKLERVGVLLFILYNVLVDNSYLIVFDDVRSDLEPPKEKWYHNLALQPPMDREWTDRLAYGLPKDDLGGGSAVVVTSRSEDVGRAMVGSGGMVHRMRPLQDELLEDGWTVFEKAFREEAGEEVQMDAEWEEMKRLIVEKCNGLPLALKVAGQKLASKKKLEHRDMPPPTSN